MILLTEKDKRESRLERRGNDDIDKFWIKKDGKDYLFKYNQERPSLSEKDRKSFGEMLYSNLGKVLNFDCVKVEFAKCPHIFSFEENGVLVESYITKPNMHSVNYYDLLAFNEENNLTEHKYLCVQTCLEVLEYYAKKNNLEYNAEGIKKELCKRTILDFFLAQTDRHTKNIEFLIDENKIFLAPCFDNGNCLSFDNLRQTNSGIAKQIEHQKYKGEGCRKLFFSLGESVDLSKLHSKDLQAHFFKDMLQICEDEPEVKEFLKDLLKVDMKGEIEQLEGQSGEALDSQMKSSSILMFDDKKADFHNFLSQNAVPNFPLSKPNTTEPVRAL